MSNTPLLTKIIELRDRYKEAFKETQNISQSKTLFGRLQLASTIHDLTTIINSETTPTTNGESKREGDSC